MANNNLYRKICIYETYGESEIILTDATDFELECIVAKIANDIENGNGSDIKKMLYDINREYVSIFKSEDHYGGSAEMVNSIGFDKGFDLCDYYNSDFEYTPYQAANILIETIRDMSDDNELIEEEKVNVAKLFKKLQDDSELNVLAHYLDTLFMNLKED